MHRRFSTFGKGSSSKAPAKYDDDAETESKGSTAIVREEPLPIPSLKIKRLDNYYSRWAKQWKYRNTSSKVTVETIPIIQSASLANDTWKDYSFVIIRTLPRKEGEEPTFKIVIKSEYILKACKDVIRTWPGISWFTEPLELLPEVFLTFFDEFTAYRDALAAKKNRIDEEEYLLSSTNLLVTTLASDYRTTLATIKRLTSHSEITFDLLYAILVPRTVFVARCAVSGLLRLFKLTSWERVTKDSGETGLYVLNCESVDLVDKAATSTVGVGRVQMSIPIGKFDGTIKIDTLDVYPLKFHPEEAKLRKEVIERGKKWVGLIGVHHKQFDGIAAIKMGDKLIKHNVRSRVMIDRATFKRLNSNYVFPTPVPPKKAENDMNSLRVPLPMEYDRFGNPIPVQLPPPSANSAVVTTTGPADDTSEVDLTEEELLLTPTVVFGFSLGDKVWLEFNIDKVLEVEWNTEAFANLVLPPDRKNLLQSLVEAHHKEVGFDDFIKGKGHGLVVNLFGPPGVGKTFSAEATSEHVRQPLYVIGGGDLGTSAAALDASLERVFDVATAWKAIVLIDEADVFLEQRSLHDLERNAMVAVFLRHVEYYRGILFLTTNRVRAFDEAFLSRIHVALHFHELTEHSKKQVWAAFIAKTGSTHTVTEEQIAYLAKKNVNGRQIKNAVRTAQSLAVARGEEVGMGHLVQTLDAMEEFTREFEGRGEGMYV